MNTTTGMKAHTLWAISRWNAKKNGETAQLLFRPVRRGPAPLHHPGNSVIPAQAGIQWFIQYIPA